MQKAIGLVIFALSISRILAADDADSAQKLAREVWKASGGENWANVQRIRFTFVVEGDGKELARAVHDWDVAGGTDEVKWKDKQVKVNIAAPAADEDSKAAYARWVNDSYWLLAPLKIVDPGVTLKSEGMKEMSGAQCETLRLSFQNVGLTPNDNYIFYIDPQTKLVRAWDYIPSAEKTIHGTWEKYGTFGGLNLSTEHNFGGKIIKFTDIEVTTK